MHYFKAGKLYHSGIVEGLNLRINLCMRKAYRYRNFELLQTSLSCTWRSTQAEVHPQILLKSQDGGCAVSAQGDRFSWGRF